MGGGTKNHTGCPKKNGDLGFQEFFIMEMWEYKGCKVESGIVFTDST